MPVFETFLSITGVTAGGVSVVSGVAQGKKLNDIVRKLDAIEMQFERIAESILYVPKAQLISDISKEVQDAITRRAHISEVLEKVQEIVETPIASSEIILTPAKMQEALSSNPWDVLFDITPFRDADPSPREGMVPILFEFQSLKFIGWQLAGALKALFGVEYSTQENIWLPRSAFVQRPRITRNTSCPCGSGNRFKHCCGRVV